MADITRETQAEQGGEPPAGGRQDHAAMRAASMRPVEVTGAASTDALAASSGLNMPGDDRTGSANIPVPTASPYPEQIPGARDPSNLTQSQPGAMGSLFNADLPPEPSTLTAATAYEREREGGGDDGNRPGKHPHHDAAKRENSKR